MIKEDLQNRAEGEPKIIVKKYTAGTPLFSDRTYFDEIGDGRLDGLFLAQIRRHDQATIIIKAKKPLTIYRLISVINDNSFSYNYEKTDIEVKVVGTSTTHTKVIKKDFQEFYIL